MGRLTTIHSQKSTYTYSQAEYTMPKQKSNWKQRLKTAAKYGAAAATAAAAYGAYKNRDTISKAFQFADDAHLTPWETTKHLSNKLFNERSLFHKERQAHNPDHWSIEDYVPPNSKNSSRQRGGGVKSRRTRRAAREAPPPVLPSLPAPIPATGTTLVRAPPQQSNWKKYLKTVAKVGAATALTGAAAFGAHHLYNNSSGLSSYFPPTTLVPQEMTEMTDFSDSADIDAAAGGHDVDLFEPPSYFMPVDEYEGDLRSTRL